MENMKTKISMKNVNMVFQTRHQTVKALEEVTLDVHEGELVSILGPSGCGKSTIIRIISDIIQPSSGEVLVDGIHANRGSVREKNKLVRKIGFVFQEPNLLPWLSIRKNVQLPLKILGYAGEKWEKHTDALLEMVGLSDYAKARPAEVSGGMMQRAGVVRAMVHDSEILLMDEPFGALDEINRELLDLELLDIWDKTKKTIVFITHNVREAVLLASRVVVMATQPGRIQNEIPIDFSYPRTLALAKEPAFTAYEERITRMIGDLGLSSIV
ncbi:MAG: ABC transporter ATP-binding protein [Treponema sp.]|jgi:NitT/TauT family transport system ATP-binding protein|nr:ABC transporter ATP-binding protein [Treponema sp.]